MKIGRSAWLLPALLSIPALAFGQRHDVAIVNGPDFSHVTTKAAARKLAAKGRLVSILLFPAELGGPDVPENTSYVTPEAATALHLITGTLVRFRNKGQIDKLQVRPDYRGTSLVPSSIVLHATDSSGKTGDFDATIDVW